MDYVVLKMNMRQTKKDRVDDFMADLLKTLCDTCQKAYPQQGLDIVLLLPDGKTFRKDDPFALTNPQLCQVLE